MRHLFNRAIECSPLRHGISSPFTADEIRLNGKKRSYGKHLEDLEKAQRREEQRLRKRARGTDLGDSDSDSDFEPEFDSDEDSDDHCYDDHDYIDDDEFSFYE